MLLRKMISQKKRPVGVTLLAAMFLWIGCLGTIFFPIILLSGGTTTLWGLIAPEAIHSQLLLQITSYLFFSVWFLFYVAYAVIGFGLWKLRNWARRSVLALTVVGGSAGILSEPFLVVCLIQMIVYPF
jgi:hypothetical protein